MAENLVTSVRREIDRLQKSIHQKTSELASLKGELKKHQRVYRLLGGTDRRAQRQKRRRRKARRITPVNWNSVLQALPSGFTIGDIVKAAATKGKSPVYLRQIAVRWARQGKTKRVARGKYQKVQQGKSRAAVVSQRKK